MQTLSQLHHRFDSYLKENNFKYAPKELYEPIDYIFSLGGKRLRPLVLLMVCDLFDEHISNGFPAAYAVEIFHNFSLVHDDIMDKAPLRRGKATVHHKYDENTGILSGDVMLIYTYKYLMELESNPNLVKILKTFNQVAIDVCEGQQYDMNFESRDDVSIKEYLKMISLKTAALVAGAMKLGALIANASDEDTYHITEFGRNMGIAFQLQDDILDTFGDPEKFGKKVGGDIVQNKKTYLVLKSLEIAEAAKRAALMELMNTPTTDEAHKITSVKNIFEALDIQTLANEAKEVYQTKAFKHLNAISVAEEKKTVLRALAEDLLGRQV